MLRPQREPGHQEEASSSSRRRPFFLLRAALRESLGRPVAITITDNRQRMMSLRRREGMLELRLHHMFLGADTQIVEALVTYICRGGRDSAAGRVAGERLDRFVAENSGHIRRKPRSVVLRPRGQHHDLQGIFDALNERWFRGEHDAPVTWARDTRAGRRRRRSIRLGTYCSQTSVIRIHPALDQSFVPDYVVSFVMFHEMLHHVVKPITKDGRTMFHTAEFRRLERSHPDYERATRWEREHLDRLLRY